MSSSLAFSSEKFLRLGHYVNDRLICTVFSTFITLHRIRFLFPAEVSILSRDIFVAQAN